MLHIVTDSSSMLTEASCPCPGFHVAPLHILYNGQSYLDGKEISAAEIVSLCKEGTIPTTSQPSIGEKMEIYDEILKDPEAQILDITIADGLSGTYQTACMAATSSTDPERITVYNSQTLAGPHRYLVETALDLRDQGLSADEICKELEKKSIHDLSMVAVCDCMYLTHSGRVPSLAGKAGSFMKLVPVAGTVENGHHLQLFRTSRTMKKAVQFMVDSLTKRGADESYCFFVAHADAPEAAEYARDLIQSRFGEAKIFVDPLCALFTVHGGPGSVSIQAIPS